MSPLVASFMPSQASNPFFRLMESEIPASPCSESAGSESSQTHGHVARRVSFSPAGETSSLCVSSTLNLQKFEVVSAFSVLKSASSSHLQAQQIADERRVENLRSAFAHDPSMKSAHHNLPNSSQQKFSQIHAMSPTENVILRIESSQSNQGVPNYLSPGLAVSKQPTSGTFAAATYSSPHVHSPTPKPRFSTHEGIA
jgi:hypothetical protein